MRDKKNPFFCCHVFSDGIRRRSLLMPSVADTWKQHLKICNCWWLPLSQMRLQWTELPTYSTWMNNLLRNVWRCRPSDKHNLVGEDVELIFCWFGMECEGHCESDRTEHHWTPLLYFHFFAPRVVCINKPICVRLKTCSMRKGWKHPLVTTTAVWLWQWASKIPTSWQGCIKQALFLSVSVTALSCSTFWLFLPVRNVLYAFLSLIHLSWQPFSPFLVNKALIIMLGAPADT